MTYDRRSTIVDLPYDNLRIEAARISSWPASHPDRIVFTDTVTEEPLIVLNPEEFAELIAAGNKYLARRGMNNNRKMEAA